MGLDDAVRPIDADDLDWLLEQTRRRRATLPPYAPRFWRPAADADARHRTHLAGLLDDGAVVAVRSSRGYLIALEQGAHWLVDDADVTPDGDWEVDGVGLLEHAEEVCGRLRLVVPVFETERMAAARAVGLFPVEQWWHRDLPPARAEQADAAGDDADLGVPGVRARLVPAPPVYDPGGPVVLITEVYGAGSLHRAEVVAARRGATVSVVTQRPDQFELADLLEGEGYVLTTAFCEASAHRGPAFGRTEVSAGRP